MIPIKIYYKKNDGINIKRAFLYHIPTTDILISSDGHIYNTQENIEHILSNPQHTMHIYDTNADELILSRLTILGLNIKYLSNDVQENPNNAGLKTLRDNIMLQFYKAEQELRKTI